MPNVPTANSRAGLGDSPAGLVCRTGAGLGRNDDDIAGTGQEGWVEVDFCSKTDLAELQSGVGGAG